MPFMARAESGFDIYLPLDSGWEQAVSDDHNEPLFFRLGNGAVDKGWSIRFNIGRDSVLFPSRSALVEHDRTPLDDGYRESVKLGVGFNYVF